MIKRILLVSTSDLEHTSSVSELLIHNIWDQRGSASRRQAALHCPVSFNFWNHPREDGAQLLSVKEIRFGCYMAVSNSGRMRGYTDIL